MFEIIPAIDLIDGHCVRLTGGDFSQGRIYSKNPLDVALQFEAAGLKRLHIVDLDGARTGRITHLNILEKIATQTDLIVDFGGGVSTSDDIDRIFASGAALINVGSIAVKDPRQFSAWIEEYGSERFILGADVRTGNILINGWQTDTSIEVIPFLMQWYERGIEHAFVTDIAKDGQLEGPALRLYREIKDAVPGLKLIASGGVTTIEDIEALRSIGCAGVIIGKALYEGRIDLQKLGSYVS